MDNNISDVCRRRYASLVNLFHDLSGQDGKLSYARAASGIIAAVDPVEREVHLKDLSLATGFTRETLLEQMNLSAARQPGGKTPAAQPARLRPAPAEPGSEDLKAQELLLSLFASGQIPKEMIDEKDFEDDELKSLYRELMAGASPASLPDLAPDDATRSRFTRILLSPSAGDTDQMITMANDCLNRIRKTRLEKRFEELSRMLDTAPDDTLPALLKEAQEISDKLKKLK